MMRGGASIPDPVAIATMLSNTPTDMPSLEDSAGPISAVFMFWLDGLFAKGFRKTLELQDLGGISINDRSDVLTEKFNKQYELECTSKTLKKRSPWSIIWRTVGYWRLWAAILLFMVSAAVQFGPVMILTRLVRHFAGIEKFDDASLWGMVILLFVFPVFGSICLAHSNTIMAHLGAQVRNILICAIYRKSLKISPFKKQSISTG